MHAALFNGKRLSSLAITIISLFCLTIDPRPSDICNCICILVFFFGIENAAGSYFHILLSAPKLIEGLLTKVHTLKISFLFSEMTTVDF